jgi:hypothetical protein
MWEGCPRYSCYLREEEKGNIKAAVMMYWGIRGRLCRMSVRYWEYWFLNLHMFILMTVFYFKQKKLKFLHLLLLFLSNIKTDVISQEAQMKQPQSHYNRQDNPNKVFLHGVSNVKLTLLTVSVSLREYECSANWTSQICLGI